MTSRLHAPREPQMRQALKAWLEGRLPGAFMVDELGIKHGKFRVDVCAITDILHGYEIKSDQDTLSRLPAQAKHFSLVFQRMTLVVGPALLAPALALVPPWWGIVLVTVGEHGDTRLAELREPSDNPRPNYRWVVRLLWRDEIAACLRAGGVRGYAKLKYWAIADLMLNSYTPAQLAAQVATVLRLRKGGTPILWPTPAPPPAPAQPLARGAAPGRPRTPSRRASAPAPAPAVAQAPAPRVLPAPAAEPSLQWLIMGLGAAR